ncbi:hypothetical protein B0070_1280 [Bifidobacterium adolescentis]|nr:hypothetical protein B0070_1280 [Bifidobacterium adolescentis]
MRNGIVHVLRNITTCLVGITLIGCAGCGVAVDQQDTKQPTGSAGSDTSKIQNREFDTGLHRFSS